MFKKKFRIFLLIILVTSVFSVILFSNSVKYDSTIENVDDTIDLYDIRVSGPQINITTPENKTYYRPMSGYYPATYGFENDKIGEDPEEWYMTMEDGDARVTEEVDGHKNVLELGSTTGKVRAGQNFTAPHTTGTIEAYIRLNDTSKVLYFLIQEDWYNSIHFAMSSDGNFYYYDGSWHNLTTYNANQWYHVKFEFDVATDWHLWIDGISIDGGSGYNFRGAPSSLNLLMVAAENPNSICYTDAIGFSWDPNYNIGNNLDEGLFVSFDLGFIPDWLGYSLDGQTTRSILGNTTIPIPADGLHTIQVFGNNSIGTLYQSDKRYFTIGEIPIDQPGIPGYQIFVIVGVISIVSAIIVKKKFKYIF